MAKIIEKKDFTIGQRIFNLALSGISDMSQKGKSKYSALTALKGFGKILSATVSAATYFPLRLVENIADKGQRIFKGGTGGAGEHTAYAEYDEGIPTIKTPKINTKHNNIIPKKKWVKQVLANRKARKSKKSKGITE